MFVNRPNLLNLPLSVEESGLSHLENQNPEIARRSSQDSMVKYAVDPRRETIV